MDYTIGYYSVAVQEDIFSLPDTLAARYVVLTRRMVVLGPHLGEPHTKAFGAARLRQEVEQDAAARARNRGIEVEGDQA